MLLNYQYRAYPETGQKLKLNEWLRICRYWYNWQLGDRFNWWKNYSDLYKSYPQFWEMFPGMSPEKPNKFSQKKLLPGKKEDLILVKSTGELLDLSSIPSQTLQDVCSRADKAFSRYIKGDKNGNRSGKPRFKNDARYRTLKVEVNAFKVERVETNFLWVSISKLGGWLRVRTHRPLPDGFKIKNLLITKKADGWYVTFCIEDKTVPTPITENIIPTWENSIGMDAVLKDNDYLATSEGTKLPSLKSYRNSEAKLSKINQRKAAKKKGSKAKRKLAKQESKQHQKISRARKDHAYKTSHELLRTGKKVFFHEKLNLKGLTKRNKAKQDDTGKYLPNRQAQKSGLNKSWNDAAFGSFFNILKNLAENAGCRVIEVKPEYTSQLLAYKDEFIFTDVNIREYFDKELNILVDRDINSGINIKRVGLGLFPTLKKRRSGNPVVTKSTTNSTMKEVLVVLERVCQEPTATR